MRSGARMKWASLTAKAVRRTPFRIALTSLVIACYMVVVVDAILPQGRLDGAQVWVGLAAVFFILFVVGPWVTDEARIARETEMPEERGGP